MADPSTIYAENMTKVSEDYDPENTTPKTHGAMRKAAERKAIRKEKDPRRILQPEEPIQGCPGRSRQYITIKNTGVLLCFKKC